MESIISWVVADKLLVICLILSGFSCSSPSENHTTSERTPVQNNIYNEELDLNGGLYDHGANTRPPEWEVHIQNNCQLERLSAAGIPDANGTVGVLGLGFSTAAMTFTTMSMIMDYRHPSHILTLVNGAQGGKDINHMGHKQGDYWQEVLLAVDSAGISPLQVQVIWMSTGDLQAYSQDYRDYCKVLEGKYLRVLTLAKELFPNLKLVLLSDRTYSGYITSDAARYLAEPTGYFHSWFTREMIRKQIDGDPAWRSDEIPSLDWGPVLWTDGENGDLFGYKWKHDDAGEGGIHPSAKGRIKEGVRLYLYILSHPATRAFFEQKPISQ